MIFEQSQYAYRGYFTHCKAQIHLSGHSSYFKVSVGIAIKQIFNKVRKHIHLFFTLTLSIVSKFVIDISEFNLALSNNLEAKMEKIDELRGTYTRIFGGTLVNCIKCTDIAFEKKIEEQFNCLQLNIQGYSNIKESLKDLVKHEVLDGDNKYEVDTLHGKQKAVKMTKFKSLPPVLQIQLKRYEYNHRTGGLLKVNDKLECDETLDLDPLLEFDDD